MAFKPAVKRQIKLKMALIGPPGSGKTWTALVLATALGSRIAMIDTETEPAVNMDEAPHLYGNLFKFDKDELLNHHPDNYVKKIREAEAAGYEVLIIDSLSHSWMGQDGALELVDKVAKRSSSGNKFQAWGDVTPLYGNLIRAIRTSQMHIICTIRSKVEHVQEKNEQGKTVVRKVGLQPVIREGVEFEMDIVADMNDENQLIVTKSRCPALTGAIVNQPDSRLGEQIREWLLDGEPPTEVDPALAAARLAYKQAAADLKAAGMTPAGSQKATAADTAEQLQQRTAEILRVLAGLRGTAPDPLADAGAEMRAERAKQKGQEVEAKA